MTSVLANNQVVWEECIKARECIKIGWPINKEYCISITACIRILKEGSKIFIELEAFNNRFRYALTNACHTFYDVGIAKFRLCVSPNGSNSVKIALEGCIDVKVAKKCWTLIAAYPKWFALSELDESQLKALSLDDNDLVSVSDNKDVYGSFTDSLSTDEVEKLLALPSA